MYPTIQMPFEFTPFSVMSKTEAKEYYEWFLSIIPRRIETLQGYVESSGSLVQLDLTQDSLISLWGWFISRIEQRKLTSEEMNEELELVAHWRRPEVKENVLKFSKDTENQIIDIGIYFSTVLLHSSNQLKWMVIHKPRNHVDVNQPVLAGTGKIRLNPIRVVDVCAARALNDAGNINMLSNLYVVVTVRGKECPNCEGDEMRYLLTEELSAKNSRKSILECNSCGWTENLDGSVWSGEQVRIMPMTTTELENLN